MKKAQGREKSDTTRTELRSVYSNETNNNSPDSNFHERLRVLPNAIIDVAIEGLLTPIAVRDIIEQKRIHEEQVSMERKQSAELRRLAQSVQLAQEEERKRIARELHDGICQQLSCMKLSTELLQDQLRTKDKSINQKLLTLASQCESMIDEIRRMSAHLRPSHLDDFGIGVTLEFLAREFRETTGIKVELDTDENAGMKLDPQIEIAIYRISQEALSNIAKYADPSHVSISLHAEGDAIVLRIEDDGAGFDLADLNSRSDPEHGLGLLGIRERVALFGGVLVIESAPDKGTSINVTITLGQYSESISNQKEKAGNFESAQAFQRGGVERGWRRGNRITHS